VPLVQLRAVCCVLLADECARPAVAAKTVTYDFHRQMSTEGGAATLLKCSEFGQAIVNKM
jgi:isocitrate dehydrogenase